jgi:hypothetical protein
MRIKLRERPVAPIPLPSVAPSFSPVLSTWEKKMSKYRVLGEKIARQKDLVGGLKWI